MEKTKNLSSGVALIRHPPAGSLPISPISGIPYTPEAATAAEEDSGLIDTWHLLVRNKKSLLLSSLGGLLIGFAVGVPMTPVFSAHTSVEVLSVNQDFMNTKQTDPTTTTEYSDDVSEEETQSQLLQGDALLKRVAIKLDPSLALVPKEARMATSGWRHWLHLPVKVEPTHLQTLIGKAESSLKVRVAPHTRLLQISANSTDPAFAALFVDTLVQEFEKQNLEARYATTQRTGDWLGQEMKEAKDNLRKSEDALQSYARSSGLIFTDNEEETNVATEKLQQLQQSLSAATADRIAKQSKLDLAKSSPPESLAEVLNDENLQGISDKINDTSRQLADASAIYNPEFSRVKRLKAELDSLQSAFSQQRADILQKINTDYLQSLQNEKLLDGAYLAQEREVTGQDEKTIQYNILKREVDSNRQLYDTMLQQMKQASIASALRASNVRVADPASASSVPVFPNFKLNSFIGMVLGFVVSLGIVSFRERADRTLQMPGEIKRWLDLPELGTIPSALGTIKRNPYYGIETSKALVDRQTNTPYAADRVELATFLHKSGLLAEAFRSTLTSVLFIGEAGNAPKVLAFTSTQPGDGKTTVVCNLGICLSEIRNKTLIIDADMRRPSVHRIFELPNARGLADILQGEFQENDLLSLCQETAVPGLHVLTAGAPSSAAAHLLHSANLAALLVKARQEYDMILIDTPPMIQMTDARVVARLVDAAVLVARSGATTRDALLAAKQRFEEDHTPVLGTILNGWDLKRATGTYYYNQYRNYANTYASSNLAKSTLSK